MTPRPSNVNPYLITAVALLVIAGLLLVFRPFSCEHAVQPEQVLTETESAHQVLRVRCPGCQREFAVKDAEPVPGPQGWCICPYCGTKVNYLRALSQESADIRR